MPLDICEDCVGIIMSYLAARDKYRLSMKYYRKTLLEKPKYVHAMIVSEGYSTKNYKGIAAKILLRHDISLLRSFRCNEIYLGRIIQDLHVIDPGFILDIIKDIYYLTIYLYSIDQNVIDIIVSKYSLRKVSFQSDDHETCIKMVNKGYFCVPTEKAINSFYQRKDLEDIIEKLIDNERSSIYRMREVTSAINALDFLPSKKIRKYAYSWHGYIDNPYIVEKKCTSNMTNVIKYGTGQLTADQKLRIISDGRISWDHVHNLEDYLKIDDILVLPFLRQHVKKMESDFTERISRLEETIEDLLSNLRNDDED